MSDRPLRIAFLTMNFAPEPGALVGLPLAKWLRDQGHEVKVLTGVPYYPVGQFYPGYKLKLSQREVIEGIPVLRVPLYPSHDDSMLRRSATYLSFGIAAATIGVALIGRADIVYLCESQSTNALPAFMLKHLRHTPLVCNVVDLWPDSVTHSTMVSSGLSRSMAGNLLGKMSHWLHDRAGRITVSSPGFKDVLVERGIEPGKIESLYIWTNENAFYPTEPDQELARQLGFAGKFNFLFAGNIGEWQSVGTIVRAAALVRDVPDIQVVIIGTGPKEAEVKALCADLKPGNVVFLPRQQFWEMTKINALADVHLVHLRDTPFLQMTIPSKTQVALACGRPILMGVGGGAAELVRAADAGITCQPDSPEDMARAMRAFHGLDRTELAAMGRRGRAFYESDLALDVAGQRLVTMFREVLDEEQAGQARHQRLAG